jgi:UDP-N-acetylmuramate--alanine ligase
MEKLDILDIKKAYLVGIKGVGMTALARILKGLNIKVVGSDTKDKFFTDEVLKKQKIKFYEGFSHSNLKKELPVDIVISSVAYLSQNSPYNPEIEFARKISLPLMTYPEALGNIFNQSFGIAICGSHGKSSTTAVLGKIFKEANLDPTVLVGSEIIEWKSNSLISKSFKKKLLFLKENEDKLNNLNWIKKNLINLPIFIIEADEYKEAFLNYYPRIIILTNIDYDHPDYFKTEKEYKQSFKKFFKQLKEPKILITKKNRILNLKPFPFPFKGKHWQENLSLVYSLIKILGIKEKHFLKSISTYKGIKRRFEIIKQKNEIVLIDDYAHHPTEVFAYYKSLKNHFSDYKIFFIFQPHTFTRTHFLFNEFLKTFKKIKNDKKITFIIFKTFPSAREKETILKIKNLKTDKLLAKKLNTYFFEKEKELIDFLNKNLLPKTVITTVGAGDVYKILENINF